MTPPKKLIIIQLCLMAICAYSQPSKNLKIDTVEANQLLNEYSQKILETTYDEVQMINDLKNIYSSFSKYELHDKMIMVNGLLAYCHSSNQDSLSFQYANKALELANRYFDTTHHSLMMTYYTLMRYHHLKNPKFAIDYAKKLLSMITYHSPLYTQVVTDLLTDYTYDNRLTDLSLFLKTMKADLDNRQLPQRYETLYFRGKMQESIKRRNYEEAVIFGEQVVLSNQKNTIFNQNKLAPIYIEIGKSYGRLKKVDKGVQYMLDGIELSGLDSTNIAIGSYYANIGILFIDNQRDIEAIEYLDKAIRLYEQKPKVYARTLGIILKNKAIAFKHLKKYEAADKAVKASKQYYYHYSLSSIECPILMSLKKYDETLEVVQEAMEAIFENYDGKDYKINPSKYSNTDDDYWAARILGTKAFALGTKGRNEKSEALLNLAIETFLLSNEFYDRIFVKLHGYEASKISYNKKINKNLRNVTYLAYRRYELFPTETNKKLLFEYTEKSKAMLLLQSLKPQVNSDKETVKQEEKLVNTRNWFEQKILLVQDDSISYYKNKLFQATLDLNNFIVENQQYSSTVMSLKNIEYPSIDVIQAGLNDEEAIINYNLKKNGFLVSVISKSGYYITEIRTKTMSKEVKSLRQLLANPLLIQDGNREKFIDLSHRLYQVLIEPIAEHLRGKTKLIIIPEKRLFELPFEVLLPSSEKLPFHELDFLIKDFKISYQYSVTIHHQLNKKTVINDHSFLGFAPVFEDGQNTNITSRNGAFLVDSLYRSIDNNRFTSLPNTEIEITSISKIIESKNGTTDLLLKSTAKKENLLQKIGNQPYQFIHIATHGLVNFKNPKLSAFACYDDNDDMEKTLLFANEVQMQKIQADLVVLSSCESGIGKLILSEGLIALNRSFIYSGANNVLFSLWKVNDRQSSKLMIRFYENYMKGQSYTEALRSAKLEFLTDSANAQPRYWAAFVLIGE